MQDTDEFEGTGSNSMSDAGCDPSHHSQCQGGIGIRILSGAGRPERGEKLKLYVKQIERRHVNFA